MRASSFNIGLEVGKPDVQTALAALVVGRVLQPWVYVLQFIVLAVILSL